MPRRCATGHQRTAMSTVLSATPTCSIHALAKEQPSTSLATSYSFKRLIASLRTDHLRSPLGRRHPVRGRNSRPPPSPSPLHTPLPALSAPPRRIFVLPTQQLLLPGRSERARRAAPFVPLGAPYAPLRAKLAHLHQSTLIPAVAAARRHAAPGRTHQQRSARLVALFVGRIRRRAGRGQHCVG